MRADTRLIAGIWSACQIDPAGPIQRLAQIELFDLQSSAAATLGRFEGVIVTRQPNQHACQLLVAFGNRGLIRVVQIHGLLAREQMLLAPAALWRFDDLLLARMDVPVAQL